MVDANIADTGAEGGVMVVLWPVLQGRDPSLTDIRVRDMGPDDSYGM